MGLLLILRIFIPFILIAMAFQIVVKYSLNLSTSAIVAMPILTTGDILTFNFFFLVTNTGSWLEMGVSISRFVIGSVFMLASLILMGVGHLLTRKVHLENKEYQVVYAVAQ